MINKLYKIRVYLFLVAIITILSILSVILIVSVVNAESIGTEIGNGIGSVVGSAVGSKNAILDAPKSYQDGVAQGLSAEDIVIDKINQSVTSDKKLSVLTADVVVDDIIEIGDLYKGFIKWSGTINFKVDLNGIKVNYEEDTNILRVIIPTPVAELSLKDNQILAESEKKNFNSADKGGEALTKSKIKLENSIEEEIENYDSLMQMAKIEAKNKITELVDTLSFVKNVVVDFAGG